MYTATKETLCTRCVHRPVCAKSEDYQNVLKAIDNISVGGGHPNSMIYVRDMDWVTVTAQCRHYQDSNSIPLVRSNEK